MKTTLTQLLHFSYERNIKLTGILYLHKIRDPLSGTHNKNAEMFGKLCGKDALQNVIIATTTWKKTEDEWELAQEDGFKANWKEMLGQEIPTLRYHHTRDSAWDILDRILQNKRRHAVRLQKEMGDAGRQLHDTAAGRSLGIQPSVLSTFPIELLTKYTTVPLGLHLLQCWS